MFLYSSLTASALGCGRDTDRDRRQALCVCVSAPKGSGEVGREVDEGAIVVAEKDEESHASRPKQETQEWSNSYGEKEREIPVHVVDKSLTPTGSNVLKTLGTCQSVSKKSCVILGDN